jgi:ATP-binding cassette subfamily F protein 3
MLLIEQLKSGKAYDFNKPYSQYLELRHEIREKQLPHKKSSQKNRGDRKINRKFRAKASSSMAQSIKKLDKIDRIEVDEDDIL